MSGPAPRHQDRRFFFRGFGVGMGDGRGMGGRDDARRTSPASGRSARARAHQSNAPGGASRSASRRRSQSTRTGRQLTVNGGDALVLLEPHGPLRRLSRGEQQDHLASHFCSG